MPTRFAFRDHSLSDLRAVLVDARLLRALLLLRQRVRHERVLRIERALHLHVVADSVRDILLHFLLDLNVAPSC